MAFLGLEGILMCDFESDLDGCVCDDIFSQSKKVNRSTLLIYIQEQFSRPYRIFELLDVHYHLIVTKDPTLVAQPVYIR